MELHVQTFGARLRARGGVFVLTNPDLSGSGQHEELGIAPHQVNAILLYKNKGSISTNAMAMALEHSVDIIVLDEYEETIGRLWPTQPSASLLIQKMQLELVGKPQSMIFVKEWISMKLRRQIAFLKKLKTYRSGEKAVLIQKTVLYLSNAIYRIHHLPASSVSSVQASIRGIEGAASRMYFSTLSKLLVTRYQFEGRSRRPAQDPFNAALNYAYGILYRTVETSLVIVGVHPYVGFLHSMEKNQKAMVFDFIDPYRPWMDNLVFQLFARKEIKQDDIEPFKKGVGFSKTGKKKLVQAFYEEFNETQFIKNGQELSQKQVMTKEAKSFALRLKYLFAKQPKLKVA